MENNVLFVDDEAHILKAIKRGLYREPYNKFFACSGDEALEILETEDIHVIVSDMKMPRMNGLELLTIVNDKYPHIVKIILSGYTQLQQILVTINRINIYKFLTKPWDMEVEFKQVLNSAIEIYNTRVENENLKVSLLKKNQLYQSMIKSNSKKLELMKNDFSFLENLNKILVNFYYLMGIKLKRGAISDEVYRDELALIGELYGITIKMMPTKHDEFNIRMLQDKLSKYLKDQKKGNNVASRVSVTNTNMSGTYIGDFSILCFTISSIIYYYFGIDYYDDFDIAITEKEKVDDRGKYIELLFLIKSDSNRILTDSLRLQTITTFFSNLVTAYNGGLSFNTINDENLALIRFPFRREQIYDNDES